MIRKFLLITAGASALAACEAYPVAVVGDGGKIYRGVATASLTQGGFFHATDGANTCSGQFTPGNTTRTVTFPVTCTNGLSGIGQASYQSGQAGGGEITMQDGSRWRFIFGQGALAVR